MATTTIASVRERFTAQVSKLKNQVSQLRSDLKAAKQAAKEASQRAKLLGKQNEKLEKKVGVSSPQSEAPRSTRRIAF